MIPADKAAALGTMRTRRDDGLPQRKSMDDDVQKTPRNHAEKEVPEKEKCRHDVSVSIMKGLRFSIFLDRSPQSVLFPGPLWRF